MKILKEIIVNIQKDIKITKILIESGFNLDRDADRLLKEEWDDFSIGTHREEIWHWFEETFNISVAKDLMGL